MHASASDLSPGPLTADDVADLLESVATAGGRLASELDQIAACRAAVSQATVARLEALIVRLRPAAAMRAQLAAMDIELLMAGATVWAQRRRDRDLSAAERAQLRWTGGVSG
jgi:hypothetical protein